MGVSIQDVANFYDLFKGNQQAYGCFDIEETEITGKVRGKATLKWATPSQAVFQRHLTGEKGIGISPLLENGSAAWGVIDLDDYPSHNISSVVKAVYDFNMPLCPYYSKSKHLHLFLFLESPSDPDEVRSILKKYADMFDMPQNVEIFPKQVRAEKFPSWLNIPYFGDSRKMLDRDMSEINISRAIEICNANRLELKRHKEVYKALPYTEAPPCIQSWAILRDVPEGRRNNWLFSAGVFFLLEDDSCDIEEKLLELNRSLDNPIDEGRLRDTVIKGMKRKTYFYNCNEHKDICIRAACQKRAHGIESKSTTSFEFGNIEQWLEDPPYYTWEVNGQTLVFYSEAEIIKQDKFRDQAFRYLKRMPLKVKDSIWAKIVNKASLDRIVHQPDNSIGGFSVGAQFLQHTVSFFHDRRPATHPDGLKLGRTYYEEDKKRYVFSATALLAYLRNVKDFRAYSPIEVQQKMVSLGASRDGPYWTLPEEALPHKEAVDIDIDFHDEEEENAKF
jgi:hypothetical protein